MNIILILLIATALILVSVVLCIALYALLHTRSLIFKIVSLSLWIIAVVMFSRIIWFNAFPTISTLAGLL